MPTRGVLCMSFQWLGSGLNSAWATTSWVSWTLSIFSKHFFPSSTYVMKSPKTCSPNFTYKFTDCFCVELNTASDATSQSLAICLLPGAKDISVAAFNIDNYLDMDPKTFSMSKDCSSYINVESRKVSRNPARLETKEEGLALLHIRWNWNWYHLN